MEGSCKDLIDSHTKEVYMHTDLLGHVELLVKVLLKYVYYKCANQNEIFKVNIYGKIAPKTIQSMSNVKSTIKHIYCIYSK